MVSEDVFRGFYAVPIPAPAAASLERATRREIESAPEQGWRPVPAARVHVTLKFLGDTPARLVPDLEAALADVSRGTAPVPVSFGKWIRLPGPRDPRVLAVEVSDPTGTLPRLAASLEARAETLGFPREARAFLCHATVARRKSGHRRRGDRKSGRTVPGPASPVGSSREVRESTVLDRVVLMKSTLGPEGPAYEVVAEGILGAGTGQG